MENRRGPKVQAICGNCGHGFLALKSRVARGWDRCCSKKCANQLRSKHRWKRESAAAYKRQNSVSAFKERMREQRGRKCQYCSRPESEIGRRLDVHRIIPEDKGGTYVPENVVVTCKSCHLKNERWLNTFHPGLNLKQLAAS